MTNEKNEEDKIKLCHLKACFAKAKRIVEEAKTSESCDVYDVLIGEFTEVLLVERKEAGEEITKRDKEISTLKEALRVKDESVKVLIKRLKGK